MQVSEEDFQIRRLTSQAARFKDPVRARKAALKAWRTIRAKRRVANASNTVSLLEFKGQILRLPPGVASSTFKITVPLIKNSKLTYVSKGGVGKQLSDGWALNFAIGCTFGCKFCYVDEIHKKWGASRAGPIVFNEWGDYFSVPSNIDEAIDKTPWRRWMGQEVMLSSTHDPYLAQLKPWTTKILGKALPEGVRFCIQTRSPLAEQDLELLQGYKSQVRLQVSIATYSSELSRVIEPRVVPPNRRMAILEKAREYNIPTGIIIAPVFPSNSIRPNVSADIEAMVEDLARVKPTYVFGESVHVRGLNQAYVEKAIGEPLQLQGFDRKAEKLFYATLAKYKLKGVWWPEHDNYAN